ncbi:MAG: hypothetical protein OXB95_13030 [Rhodobacteraceae bacterium]|nr:hypothetical protein [Paracoccaceae bacterium]
MVRIQGQREARQGAGSREFVGDGEFRSAECIEILKQADIVVTIPPFSLFRKWVAQLVQYGKRFLIVGSQNAIQHSGIVIELAVPGAA